MEHLTRIKSREISIYVMTVQKNHQLCSHKKDVENYSDEALKELIKKKIDKAATFKLTNNTDHIYL